MELVGYIFTFIGGVVTAILPFIYGKKKEKAEAESVVVRNARALMEEYRILTEELKATNARLDQTNAQLLEDNFKQKEMYQKVLLELEALKKTYAKLEKSYQVLKQEFKK